MDGLAFVTPALITSKASGGGPNSLVIRAAEPDLPGIRSSQSPRTETPRSPAEVARFRNISTK
jgi:hypothetical protein